MWFRDVVRRVSQRHLDKNETGWPFNGASPIKLLQAYLMIRGQHATRD
jgi:hypothetical protein